MFCDMYECMVHNDTKLSKVEKLTYLKTSLIGEAAQLCKHITITEANYDSAWSLLKERYNKQKHIVYDHIRKFYDQDKISHASATALRKLYNTSNEVIRALDALDKEHKYRDSWLIFMLIDKLDPESRTLWCRDTSEINLPNLNHFFQFLGKRCDELEAQPNNQYQSKSNIRSSQKSQLSTVVVKSNVAKCKCCEADMHPLYKCATFNEMSIEQKREFARKGV